MENNYTDNLDRFIKAIDDDANVQIKEIIETAKAEAKEIVKQSEDEALRHAYELIQMEIRRINAEYQRIYAQAEQDERKKVLIHRDNLVNKVFGEIKGRLIEYTNSDKYLSFLKSLLKDEEISENMVIFLSKKDMKFKDELLAELSIKCKVEEDDSITLGGLSLYDAESSTLLDKTLDNSLDEQKKNFSSEYRF